MTKTRLFSLNAITSFDVTFGPETVDKVIIYNSRASNATVKDEPGQYVQMDDLTFAIGAKWHSFVTENPVLRALIIEMQGIFPAPAIA